MKRKGIRCRGEILQPQFRTSTGRLTAYSICCGYLEQKEAPGEVITTLWHEGAVYHVKQFDHDKMKVNLWESFETLAEARNCFGRAKGKLTTKRLTNNECHGVSVDT